MKILRNAVLRKLQLMFLPIVFGGLFFGSFQMTYGQTTTFAQFTQNPAGQNFVFTNNTTTATFGTTPTTGVQVNFNYSNINGLNAALTGTQSAKLFITTTTTEASVSSFGNFLAQPLSQSITISIIRDTATSAGVGTGARTNLLTAVITIGNSNPSISGQVGATSGNFSAATTNGNQNVTFTSDFLSFSNTSERDLAIAFSSIQPALAISGDFLRSFAASGTGTFASNPAPVVAAPPTAATVSISGRVLTPAGRGLRNALVTVTQADGSTRTILTNNSGSYSFAGLDIPQTIIVSVISKSYLFNPRVFSLDSDFAGMDFTPVDNKYN